MKYVASIILSMFVTFAHASDDDGYVGDSEGVGADFFDKQPVSPEARILAGDYSAVKSCKEVAIAKVGYKNISGYNSPWPMTENNKVFKRSPSGEIIAELAEIIGVEGDVVYTRKPNSLNSDEWGFVLRSNNQTRWLKDDIRQGRTVYFVGRYVGNTNVPIVSGSYQHNLQSKLVDLMCAQTN